MHEAVPAETRARVSPFKREPERWVPVMRRHRTIARGILLVAILGLMAGPAAARLDPGKLPKRATPAPGKTVVNAPSKRIIFPVLGKFRYSNDFGAPRGQGRHEGIDIVAPRKALAVAAEAGQVTYHFGSQRAGCMLYLHGDSGATYLYVHLNNDVGMTNDNRGLCAPGTAFAPGLRSGARVAAGEPIVSGNRAAVEWWGIMRDEGEEITLPGILMLRFAPDGRCEELRECWHVESGRIDPPAGWGR